MSRVTPYVKTDWEDTPSTSSPINSIHLNHLETGVKNVTDAVNEMVVEVEPATANRLGGIKVGSNLSITQDGTLSADAQQYTLPTASASTKGGIKVGSRLSIDANGALSADDQSYTLPIAAANTLGGVKVGSGLSIAQDGTLSTSGGGGASSLNDLNDVTISNPTEGQVLKYDATNQKWVNGTGGSVIEYATSAQIIALFNDGTDVYLDGESPLVTF